MVSAERLSFLLQGASLMFLLFLTLSLFRSEQRSRLKSLLAFVLALFAFGEMKDLLRIFPAITESVYAMRLMYTIDMWALGVCAAYVLELVSPHWFTLRRVLALTINFVILSVAYAITASEVIFYIDLVYVLIFELSLVGLVLIWLRRYNRYIRDNYSNLERINVDWVYSVLIVFSVCIVLWTVYLFNHNYLMKSLYYVVSIVAWSILISRSKTQMEITIEEPAELVPAPQPIEQSETEPAIVAASESDTSQLPDLMKAQLDELMSARELYLNSRLTLSDLAAELGTNRTYLSNYLNRELNVSFYDYINAFRVKRACEMIDANPDVAVQTIVDNCGFNSVSTFRRSFAREIGQTCGEYRRKALS